MLIDLQSYEEIQKRLILREYIRKEYIRNTDFIVFVQGNHIGLAKKDIFDCIQTLEFDGNSKKYISRKLFLYDESIKVVLLLRKEKKKIMKEKLKEWLNSLLSSDKVTVDEAGQKTISDKVLTEEIDGLKIFDDLTEGKEDGKKQLAIEDIAGLTEQVAQIRQLIEEVSWLKSLIQDLNQTEPSSAPVIEEIW